MALGDSYVTTTSLAEALRVGDSDDDVQLDLAVDAASEWVRSYCGKDFNLADAATPKVFHATDLGVVWVDPFGSPSGLVVATDTGDDGTYETIWTSADYQLEPFNAPAAGVPYTLIRAVGSLLYPHGLARPAVQVTARWGWPTVPASVKQATLILAAALYKRRDSAEGVLGGFEFGPVRVGTRIDPHVEQLLSPYRDIVLA